MHLFDRTPLLYLFLHVLAFVCLFASIMGTPGNPDENDPWTKKTLKVANILLLIGWKGFPSLFVAALLAFFFRYDIIGKIICCFSFGIGLSLFFVMVLYYNRKSK